MVKNEMYSEEEAITGKFIPLIYTVSVLDYKDEYLFFPL